MSVSPGSLHADSLVSWPPQTAQLIGRRVGNELDIPVLYYGAAHQAGRRLADIRRAAGYFKGSAGGVWKGKPTLDEYINGHDDDVGARA